MKNGLYQPIFIEKGLFNFNIRGVHSATFGLEWDTMCYAPPDALYLQNCHSRGAVYTRNALMCYPPDLRGRIKVIAVAPGAYIDSSICHSVVHLVSKRDAVPMFDFAGAWRCRDTIVYLNPHPNAPIHDHSFISPTYVDSLRFYTNQYLKN